MKYTKVFTAVTAAAALVLGLTACAAKGGAAGEVKADANGALPITIGYTALGAGYSDLYVAQDEGIFAKHGLNVTLNRLNDSSQLVAALASGSRVVGFMPRDLTFFTREATNACCLLIRPMSEPSPMPCRSRT